MDIRELMPSVEIDVDVEVEVEVEVEGEIEIETETETIMIDDFTDFEDEIIASDEREMGAEHQHHLTGTVVDSQGNYYTTIIEVWEYPEGAINTDPMVIKVEKE